MTDLMITPEGNDGPNITIPELETCYGCDEQFAADAEDAEEAFLHDSPDHEGETRRFCSAECYDNCINASEFGYFTCDKCERTICRQFMLNGYYSFERWLPELEKTFCEACYNDRMFRVGQSFSSEIEIRDIRPETYGNPDLMNNGFEKDCVVGFDTFVETARGLVKEGYFVIAIQNYCFGSGAYSPTAISLWKKLNPVLVDGMEFKAKETRKEMKLKTYNFSPEILKRHGFEFHENLSGDKFSSWDGNEIYSLKERGKCVIVIEQKNGPNQLWCKDAESDQKVEENVQENTKSKKRLFE